MAEAFSDIGAMKTIPSDAAYTVCGIPSERSQVEREFPLHWHDHYELELVLSGAGRQAMNGASMVLAPGCLYLLRPTDTHHIWGEQPLTFLSIKLVVSQLPDVLQKLLSSRSMPALAYLAGEELVEVKSDLSRLERELSKAQPCDELCIHALIALTLSRLLRSSVIKDDLAPSIPAQASFYRALCYVQEHYRGPIKESDAAKAAGLSPNYFCKQFSCIFGCHFVEYVTRQRLQLAQTLLTESEKNHHRHCLFLRIWKCIPFFANLSEDLRHYAGTIPVPARCTKAAAG